METTRFDTPDSSMVRSLNYNYSLNQLTVIFWDNSKYVYEGVPSDIYSQIKESSSTGRAFNALVKNKYEFTRYRNATTIHEEKQKATETKEASV